MQLNPYTISNEAIGFQDTATFSAFTDLFDKLKKSSFKGKEELVDIVNLTKSRFGLSIKLQYDYNGTRVYPPAFNQNHIFFQNHMRDAVLGYGKNLKEGKFLKNLQDTILKNRVSLKDAKVEGFFSTIESAIFLDKDQLRNMQPDELAAVYLHEVGHLFTFYEQMVKVTTSNYVLVGLCSLAESQASVQEKTLYIEQARKNTETYISDRVKIEELNDPATVATLYISSRIQEDKSSIGSYFYDAVSCEQMADQFVSRLGGGRALVTALDKINKLYGEKNSKTFTMIKDIFTVSFIGLKTLLQLFLSPVFGLLMLSVVGLIIFNSGTHDRDYTYDNAKVRIKRLKNEYAQKIKEEKDPKALSIIVKEYEVCEKIENGYHEYRSIVQRLADFMLTKNKDAKAAYELQRDLEDIGTNALFIKSSKLSSLL